MQRLEPVPAAWLLHLVNHYAPEPRRESGLPAGASYRPLDGPFTSGPDQLVPLADALWQVFAESDRDQQAARLTEILRRAELAPAITSSGDLAWSTWHEADGSRLAAACAVALTYEVQRLGWDRLGICGGGDCADAFIDDGRRAHRVYCSTTCLNRARVRAYRDRRRTQLPARPRDS